jgi:ectoine hydroxylase-related dioxygenase (phytanoyl-CoA dioxygenase family)
MEEAGGLELVPGSHTLKMLPLNGPDELDDWRTDMYEAARTAGHKKIRLSLAKGDVLILHAQLLQGSAAAPDMAATRKTYMFHYFTEPDLRATTTRLIPQAGGFWYKPQPRPLPLDVLDVLPFVEQAYLIRHPDVAQAVKDGHFATGQAHYEAFGKQEGRMPF